MHQRKENHSHGKTLNCTGEEIRDLLYEHPKITGTCLMIINYNQRGQRTCRGNIVEKTEREFDPMSGPPIIGPGSANQYRDVHKGFYCTNCGVRYEFIPDWAKLKVKEYDALTEARQRAEKSMFVPTGKVIIRKIRKIKK